MSSSAGIADPVASGQSALAIGAWLEARAAFKEALLGAPSAEAWEGLSWANWWLEDVDRKSVV